jgi:hypothetical protein
LGNLKELSSENQTREFRFQYLIFYRLGGYLFREKKYQEANEHLQIARKILDMEGMRKTYYYMDVLNLLVLSEMADFNEEKRYFSEERKETILSLGSDYYEIIANLGFKFDSLYADSFESLGEFYCDYLDESFPRLLFKFITFQRSNRYKGALFYKNALIIYEKLNIKDLYYALFLQKLVRQSYKNPHLKLDDEKRIEYLKLAIKISEEKREKELSKIINEILENDNIFKRLKEGQRSVIFSSAILVVIPLLLFILVLWGNSLLGEYKLWNFLSLLLKFILILLFIYFSYQLTNDLIINFY